MRHHFGTFGIVLGLIAIGVAIFQNDLRGAPVPEPEPAAEEDPSLTDLAIEASKKLLREKVLKQEPAAAPKPTPNDHGELAEPHDAVALTYMGLGFAAMVLGIVSWVRKDHIRLSGGAVALGLVAVAWQYVLIGVAVAIVIFLLANFGA